MPRYRPDSIATRFGLSLAIMALGFFLLMVFVHMSGRRVRGHTDALAATVVPAFSLSQDAVDAYRREVRILEYAVLSGETELFPRAYAQLDGAIASLDDLTVLPHTTAAERLRAERAIEAMLAYSRGARDIYPRLAAGEGDSATVVRAAAVTAAAARADSLVTDVHTRIRARLDAELADVAAAAVSTQHAGIILFLALAGLASVLAWWVVHRLLLRPLYSIRDAALRVADGDFTAPPAVDRRDEIGDLAEAIGTMTARLQGSLDDLRRQVAERERAESLVRDMNRQLEERVAARTHELTASMDALRAAQTRLVQSEKMAGIGQLAAGVAHEINNPVGYVMSNLGTLRDYAASLRRVLDAYEGLRAATQGDPARVPGAAAAAAAAREEEDLDYLLDDMPDLLAESLEGTERVRDIVQNLKSFARADDTDRGEVDLHECLASTLRVVWNELKYKAEVVRDYADELPPVVGCPGQLNQVFMNLLVNAGQAIPDRGTVTVRTRHDAETGTVVVQVADTGAGIDAGTLPRLFEPFFTTKAPGKGTGLGLSISHGIVEEHGGAITVESTPGEGATFTVTLPAAVPAALA